MIAAAAHAHGVFLQGAQARHGLARAGHARAIRRHGPRDRCGGGGDAAQVAQEVQRHALGRQHGAGAALDARDLRARLQHAAVRARHAEADRRIQRAERQPRQVQPGQHASWRATRRVSAWASAGTMASVVKSPARPRSSSSAARTTGSSITSGSGGTGRRSVAARASVFMLIMSIFESKRHA